MVEWRVPARSAKDWKGHNLTKLLSRLEYEELPYCRDLGGLGGESLFASFRISHTGNTVSSWTASYRPPRMKYRPP